MNWKQRFREMLIAGGVAGAYLGCSQAGSGSPGGGGLNFCCNANGDPCCAVDYCGAPMTPECQAEKECLADGGVRTGDGCCPRGSTLTSNGECVAAVTDAGDAGDGEAHD
jgi:hypothetical protein